MADPPPAADVKPAKASGKGGAIARLGGMLLAFAGGAAAGGAGAAMALQQLGGMPGGGQPKERKAEAHPVEYVEIDNAFTSNLTDTGRYLQLRLAVSTTGGEPVTAALAAHKLAVISAVLAILGDLAEADVADRAAKDKLRGQLRTAIDAVLSAKGAPKGIDDVYFTSLVVQ